jgi:release factor glutamine methyltransferase
VNAQEIIDDAVETLEAAPALDHWQKHRERIEAEELLDILIGTKWKASDDIDPAVARRFRRLVARRATGEPVPYIRGTVEFRGLHMLARPGVFVPRESSEFLAEQAVRRLRHRRAPVAVDLATGSGPVALSIANEVKGAEVYGTDLSPQAIALARRNARKLRLHAHFLRGDLFGALPPLILGNVDVLTFHPPYVGRRELRELPDEVVKFEPVMSLTDHSPRGMGLIERAALESWDWLRPGGWFLVEVSSDRSRQVATILRRAGYRDVRSTKGGLEVTRVVTARVWAASGSRASAGGAAVSGAAVSGVAQFRQNLAMSGLSWPQDDQVRTTGAYGPPFRPKGPLRAPVHPDDRADPLFP